MEKECGSVQGALRGSSRAWAFTRLAKRLPEDDPRIEPMLTAARRHADASLGHVAGNHSTVEHWLAAYAMLLLG